MFDAVDQATQQATKKDCTELKNFANPPESIIVLATHLADFVQDKSGTTWNQAKSKLFEYLNRGVGARDRVSEDQLATLRAFAQSGITSANVMPKSRAAGSLVLYMEKMLELQEHLLTLENEARALAEMEMNGGVPDVVNVESGVIGNGQQRNG